MLRCDQCGAIDAGPGLGWRAMLGLEDDDETEAVEVFCPECYEREFGPVDRS